MDIHVFRGIEEMLYIFSVKATKEVFLMHFSQFIVDGLVTM